MGLLDAFNTDAGLLGLMLMNAGRAQPVRQNVAGGLLEAMQGLQQHRAGEQDRAMRLDAAKRQNQLQDLHLQQAQDAITQQRRQREQEDAFRALIPSPQMQQNSAALAGGGGPTVANAAKIGQADPMAQLNFEAMRLGQIKPGDYLASLRKDTTPVKLGAGETLFNPQSWKPLATNPKAEDTPSAVREYNFAVSQGYRGSFQQFQLEQKRAGATNVSVSMDKGFGDAFAKDAAAYLSKSRDSASGAANTLRTLDRIDNVMRNGNVITGPAATPQLVLAQVGNALGLAGKDTAEKLANTRQLMQGAASLAVDGAQALAGQGQITDKERELVNRMAGGNIDTMSVPEIQSTLGVLRKINAGRVQQHQSQMRNVGPEFQKFAPFYDVAMPQPTVVDFGSLK